MCYIRNLYITLKWFIQSMKYNLYSVYNPWLPSWVELRFWQKQMIWGAHLDEAVFKWFAMDTGFNDSLGKLDA